MQNRYIAHITIEAQTPLKVGTNDKDFFQDSPVQRDWNGLPMILGTSIAGVLRKEFDESRADTLFGKEDGSKVIFSNALLLDENAKVNEELLVEKSDFLKIFDNLPLREHTAITDKGVAKDKSKFDEEVIYKGSKFRFSIEVLDDETAFHELLSLISSPLFRLGSGTSKGFGQLSVLTIRTKTIKNPRELADHTTSLNDFSGDAYEPADRDTAQYTIYKLQITPENFFMFGSGFGDNDADLTPVYEKVVSYNDKKGLSDRQILIPASSVKGALSHRTAFYYNQMMLEQGKDHTRTGEENDAIKAIFGHKKEKDKQTEEELGQKGNLLLSDCFKPDNAETKVFDHVAIDRFTGGAINGALFQEKTIEDDRIYEIEILLLDKNLKNEYLQAFENAMKDITTGMLPLGGATTKGHGVFVGSLLKNGAEL